MEIRKISLWMIVMLCAMTVLTAQTVRDVMNMNMQVYELVGKYVANADLTNNYTGKSKAFQDLFENASVPVFMDHIQQNAGFQNTDNQVSLTEYLELYRQNQGSFLANSFVISGVSLQPKSLQAGVAQYEVQLTKSYRVSNIAEEVVCQLVLEVSCPLSDKKAKITGIRCISAIPIIVPEVVENQEPEKIEKGSKAKTHAEEKAREEKAREEKAREEKAREEKAREEKAREEKAREEKAREEKVREEKPRKEKEPVTWSCATAEKNAVGVEFGYNHPLFFQSNKLPEGTPGQFVADSYTAHQFPLGITYQRQLFARDRHLISVETGLSVAFCSQRFQADQYRENIPAVDPDGTAYIRETQVSNYNELSKSTLLYIPLSVRYDFFIMQSFSVFATLGVQGGVSLGRPVEAQFDAAYAGQYGPELYNVWIGQNGYYDFGTYEDLSRQNPKSKACGMFGVSLSLGLHYAFNNRWSADLSANLPFQFVTSRTVEPSQFRLSENSTCFQSVNESLLKKPVFAPGFKLRVQYHF